jgi:U3 small nucleolar RNA-associated protein 10
MVVLDDVKDSKILIQVMFEVLSILLQLSKLPSLEYAKQLVLSFLTNILKKAQEKQEPIEDSVLRVDLLVQCVRTTDNPQTHHHALLLMSLLASTHPEKILVNVMPIFTFMGASLLRHDDNYSLQVVRQTLQSIVPPLVASKRETVGEDTDALIMSMKPIIQVFVNALFHVPKHRRLKLFVGLLEAMGEQTFLFAVLLMLLGRYDVALSTHVQIGQAAADEPIVDFAMVLCNQFNPVVQTDAWIRLLSWASDLDAAVNAARNGKKSDCVAELLIDLRYALSLLVNVF